MKIDLNQPQTRDYQCRTAASTEAREIRGIGVPLESEEIIVPGFRESFAQDCEFEGIDRAKLLYRHREVIGVTAAHERAPGEFNIVTRVSQTRDGDDALTLARDGALDSFSIGFTPIEWETRDTDDGVAVKHTRVRVREFSLVPFPAYTGAVVSEVREQNHPNHFPERNTTMPELDAEKYATELAELREQQGETLRMITAVLERSEDAGTSAGETRSAGQILQALAAGDEATREYVDQVMERAYTGGTTADAPIKDGWVGDLTKIFDASSGVLSAFFADGTLPDKGMNVEYAELLSNTVKVEEQANEGDDLAYGKVQLTTKTAPVKTYGGYVQLTRQQIQRSTLPILDRSLEALSVAAGQRKKAVLRAAYLALVTARKAVAGGAGVLPLGDTLADADALAWTNLVVDASVRFSQLGRSLDGLIVSPDVFKRLNALETQGHKLFKVASERNLIGVLDLTALSGDLVGVPVVGDPDRAGEAAEFSHRASVRSYDSAVVQLQDENIINLSKDFSVYRFGATAPEIPAGVVPVDFTAAGD